MVARGITLPVEVEGAQQAQRELNLMAGTVGKVDDATKKQGQTAERSGRANRVLSQQVASVGNAMAGLVSVGGAMTLFNQGLAEVERRTQAAIDRQRELAQATKNAIDQSINLRFLGASPEDVAQARGLAAEAGRDPEQGVRHLAEIISRRPNASRDEQFGLFESALRVSQFDPTADLGSFVNPLLTLGRFGATPSQAENILFKSIEQAGVTDPAKLSPLFAQFLGIGTSDAAGLSTGEAAGAISAVTSLGLDPAQAVTGLRNVTTILQGKASGPAEEALKGLRGDDLISTLENLSAAQQRGELPLSRLAEIAGRENAAVLQTLIRPENLANFRSSVGAVGEAAGSRGSLATDRFGEIIQADPAVGLRDVGRRASAQAQRVEGGSSRAVLVDSARAVLNRELVEAEASGDVSAAERENILATFDRAVANGSDPIIAAVTAAERGGNLLQGIFQNVPLFGAGADIGDFRGVLEDEFNVDLPSREAARAVSSRFGRAQLEPPGSRAPITQVTVNNPIIGAEDARSVDPTGEGD